MVYLDLYIKNEAESLMHIGRTDQSHDERHLSTYHGFLSFLSEDFLKLQHTIRF